jgi:hypothetical protein
MKDSYWLGQVLSRGLTNSVCSTATQYTFSPSLGSHIADAIKCHSFISDHRVEAFNSAVMVHEVERV